MPQPLKLERNRLETNAKYYPNIIVGPRQSGKTTQLLQVIREIVDNVYFENREVVVFSRNQTNIDCQKRRLGSVSDQVTWKIYNGEGIPPLLGFRESDSVCVFLEATFNDDVVKKALKRKTFPNPCYIELPIDCPGLKFVI